MKLTAIVPSKPGSLWMLVAAFFFAIMGALVKLASEHFSSAELVFYRSIFGLVIISLFVHQHRMELKTPMLGKHLTRSCLGFLALLMFFYALSHLPLATAMTLNYTSPLFMAIFAGFMLHERPKSILMIAILAGFAGVALLLRPSLHVGEWLAASAGLLSGLTAGLVYVHVTQLGRAGEPDWRTVFYFTLVSTVGAGLWILLDGFQLPDLSDLPILIGLGASATLAQMAMTRAYRTGNHLVVGSLAYATVVMASLLGIIFWNETLSMDRWLAVGLIILAGIISVRASPR